MATKTFKVSLSLDNPRIIQSGINVQSFDKQSVKISIALTKDSQTYQIPTGAQIKISLLKLARQEQKIILDVPFTSADSIDWIVPDYLDGYQGEVRVGVYLIVDTENIDVGYFNITSSVSDIDSAAEEFTESVLQGWAIEDLTALLPKFQEVIDETTGKDVISAPEIILARNGEVDLKTRLDKEKQEVTAQLAQTVSGELGKKPVALAGVIRNTGSGWFYIDDAGHNRINMSAVSVQNGSIRVEHTGGAKKVGALVATPDETFGKEGMIVGASVGNTFSLIDLFLPLNVQIKGDGTFAAKSYFTPSLALTFSADKSSFTLEHPESDALDIPMLVSPISAGSSGEFAVSYSSTQVTVERRGDLAGYIYYETASSTWKYQGDNVNDLNFTFDGGVLTVTHSAVVGNLYGLIVSERDGGYKPIVVSPLTGSFQIKLKDTSGNTISIPDANCKFYFARIGAKYKMPFKPTERVVLKRGHAKVDATHVVNTSGNIWIHGLMQN